jgi:hypothetical protein
MKDWRKFLWRNWPDRQNAIMIKTRDLSPYEKKIRLSPPMAVIIIMSPYWARPGVCKL